MILTALIGLENKPCVICTACSFSLPNTEMMATRSYSVKESYQKTLAYCMLFLLLAACGPAIRVTYDKEPNTSIANYKTYSWLKGKEIEEKGLNPLFYNELNDVRIKNAVNKHMRSKGFTFVDSSSDCAADLQLHYHIVVENKTSETVEPFGYYYPTEWRKVNIYSYREGTLIIDLMDTKRNMLVWRGTATEVITAQTSAKPEKAINDAVARIFEELPHSAL